MRLCTIKRDGREEAAVVTRAGIVPVAAINAQLGKNWPAQLYGLIHQGISPNLLADAEQTALKLDPKALR
jgi:hypothetical protein